MKIYVLVSTYASHSAPEVGKFSSHAVECLREEDIFIKSSEERLRICITLLKMTLKHSNKEHVVDVLTTAIDVIGTATNDMVESLVNNFLPLVVSSLQRLKETNSNFSINVDSLKNMFIKLPNYSSHNLSSVFLELLEFCEGTFRASVEDIDSLLKAQYPQCQQVAVSLLGKDKLLQKEVEQVFMSKNILETTLLSHYLPAVNFILTNIDDNDNIGSALFEQCWDGLQKQIQQIGDGHQDPSKNVEHGFKSLNLLLKYASPAQLLQLLETSLNTSRNSEQFPESFVAELSDLSGSILYSSALVEHTKQA